jgi:3-oxoacyl-[acyl-carrier protein] reductase
MQLSNRIALVTGASRGIGRAIADSMVAKGAYVVGTATTQKGAEDISFVLGKMGHGVVLEVTNGEMIQDVMQNIKDQFGRLDILANNAGITKDQLLLRMKISEWQQVLDVNLTAFFYLAKAAISIMVKQRYGRIISIGSIVGSSGNAGQTNYAAAKSGLIGCSKSLAIEVAKRGITVNVVSPGFVDTDMVSAMDEERRKSLMNLVPLGRMGHVNEIASAVSFLASEEAAYITGETLHVNGGLYMS